MTNFNQKSPNPQKSFPATSPSYRTNRSSCAAEPNNHQLGWVETGTHEFSDAISCCTDYENSSDDKTLKYPDCPDWVFPLLSGRMDQPRKEQYLSTIHMHCSGKNEPTRPLGSFG